MIFISQWLCPLRHCSIALAWDDSTQNAAEIEAQGEALYATSCLNRWCGICHGDLEVEHGRTGFKTMEEAMPHLKEQEAENRLARAILARH